MPTFSLPLSIRTVNGSSYCVTPIFNACSAVSALLFVEALRYVMSRLQPSIQQCMTIFDRMRQYLSTCHHELGAASCYVGYVLISSEHPQTTLYP